MNWHNKLQAVINHHTCCHLTASCDQVVMNHSWRLMDWLQQRFLTALSQKQWSSSLWQTTEQNVCCSTHTHAHTHAHKAVSVCMCACVGGFIVSFCWLKTFFSLKQSSQNVNLIFVAAQLFWSLSGDDDVTAQSGTGVWSWTAVSHTNWLFSRVWPLRYSSLKVVLSAQRELVMWTIKSRCW